MVNKNSNSAIALLCRYPDNIWLNFLENFSKYDIYIIIDENKNDYDELYKQINHKLNIIQIDDNYCIQNGFYNFVHPTSNLPNKPLSSDLDTLNLNYLYHPMKNYIDQLKVKMNNYIYYDNLFNNINYNNKNNYPFKFNELLFLSKNLPEGFDLSI